MKVTISCVGRFHAYHLAAELEKHAVLRTLITTYPEFEVRKYGVPSQKIKSVVHWEFVFRALMKGCRLTGVNANLLLPRLHQWYDHMAKVRIPVDTTVFVGWSGVSENALLYAKSLGALTILERCSSHIGVQTALLQEEYKRYHPKGDYCFTHPRVIEKELREYEIADYISVPSTFAKNSFLSKHFPESKIVQNPYGVNLTKFVPGVKHDNIFRVLFVGQMSLRKGVHYLLEAFSSLKIKEAELVLIGSMMDEMKPFLEKYNKGVRYLGVKTQQELVYHYQQASVFVICSIEEGMAYVQAQAMASGLPLICTTNTGGDDLIRNGREGFVIPIRNVQAIQEKIEWMYEHQEEAKHMGALARERVASGFTWGEYGDRYYQFLTTQAER